MPLEDSKKQKVLLEEKPLPIWAKKDFAGRVTGKDGNQTALYLAEFKEHKSLCLLHRNHCKARTFDRGGSLLPLERERERQNAIKTQYRLLSIGNVQGTSLVHYKDHRLKKRAEAEGHEKTKQEGESHLLVK